MRVGGRLAIMSQGQSTGGSSQRCPGFDSQRLPTFSFLYFHLITSKFIYFQHEARRSTHVTGCHLCSVSTYQEEKACVGQSIMPTLVLVHLVYF